MSHPTYSEFSKTYDGVYGPDEFKRQVALYGDRVFRSENRYVAPHEAIKAVYDYYSKGFQKPPAPVTAPGAQAPVTTQSAAPPPVIPNVGSGAAASSPTKARYKTLDALKKHVKEMTQG